MWIWVARGQGKPYPVSIKLDEGEICYEAFPPEPLTDKQSFQLDKLVQGIISDIRKTWNGHTEKRLMWTLDKDRT